MDKQIFDIYNSLQEIAWKFGSHGIDGECCGDLSFIEFMALKKINGSDDISIQEIGNTLNFTKSGATRIINRLEKKGYALRKNFPADGRICCVSMTAKGMEAISKIMENYTAYLQNILKGFGPEEVQKFRDTLEILVNAVQNNESFNSATNTNRGGKCC
jgi:MarR family transcriptional regulator, organic hydroperoxide resistance regulator